MTNPSGNASDDIIRNPQIRRRLGIALYALSLTAGIATLFFMFFPEFAYGTDIPLRAIGLINGVVSFVSGAFGLTVTVPNAPRFTAGPSARDPDGL